MDHNATDQPHDQRNYTPHHLERPIMRRPTLIVTTALTALTLAACTGADDTTEPASEPPSIDSIDTLDTYLADTYSGDAELHDGDLTVAVDSQGSELQDQNMTVTLLQTIGGSPLDYETVTITTSTGDGPTWGYRYDADTVDDIAGRSVGDGSLVVDQIWDEADGGTN